MSPPPPEPGRAGQEFCNKCGGIVQDNGEPCAPVPLASEEERLARERLKIAAKCVFPLLDPEQTIATLEVMAPWASDSINRVDLALRTYADAQSRAAVERAERAEGALAEAAMEINCAGPVAHRIHILKQEHAQAARARVKQELDGLARRMCHYCNKPAWYGAISRDEEAADKWGHMFNHPERGEPFWLPCMAPKVHDRLAAIQKEQG